MILPSGMSKKELPLYEQVASFYLSASVAGRLAVYLLQRKPDDFWRLLAEDANPLMGPEEAKAHIVDVLLDYFGSEERILVGECRWRYELFTDCRDLLKNIGLVVKCVSDQNSSRDTFRAVKELAMTEREIVSAVENYCVPMEGCDPVAAYRFIGDSFARHLELIDADVMFIARSPQF